MNDTMNLNTDIDLLSLSDVFRCIPENCLSHISDPNKLLKIFTQNIRSINRNFSSLETLLHRIPFESDVLVLTECWLPCKTNSTIPILTNYSMHQTTKHLNQSDGVVIYIKSHLSFSTEEINFNNKCASGLIIKLGTSTAIVCIYRSPSNENIDDFLLSLKYILPSLSSFKSVILTGDINIGIETATKDSRRHDYLTNLAFHGYLPAHTIPTRENSCLDHLILRTKLPSTTLVIETTVTDHFATLLCLETKYPRCFTASVITTTNYDTLDETMKCLDLSPIFSIEDPNVATDAIVQQLSQAIQVNSTEKSIKKNKRIFKPWITPGLLRCMRNRDNMH